jgi:hypothetical protein
MNNSIDQRHRDSDLFGLLYGFSFRPGERGRKIDSAGFLRSKDRSLRQLLRRLGTSVIMVVVS